MEVVEIDPGVTQVAHDRMGLPRDTHIISHHMDGRRFVVEHAPRGHYQFMMQDAVNDLSVPYHLLTKEYNDAVKRILVPDGVYLLTLIDSLQLNPGLPRCKLWQAAVNTLRETFRYVHLLSAKSFDDPSPGGIRSLCFRPRPRSASLARNSTGSKPAPLVGVSAAVSGPILTALKNRVWTHQLPDDELGTLLNGSPRLILTDQYAPVDNLMAETIPDRSAGVGAIEEGVSDQ